MAVLSQTDQKKIEACVQQAEAGTSGEIVVLYLKSAGAYAWVYFAWATLGMFFTSFVVAFFSYQQWPLSALQMLEWQLVGLAVGLAVSLVPAFRRCLVPSRTRASKVHRAALAAFTAKGVFETRGRSGILICVSEFEHLVEILADRGIHEKLGLAYWKRQADAISAGVKKKQAVVALTTSIEEMAKALKTHFPRNGDDTNELPDTVHDS